MYCTLKVGGYFLFNIEHPTFNAGVNEDWIYDENGKPKYWPIDNYYYPVERETNFLGQRQNKTFPYFPYDYLIRAKIRENTYHFTNGLAGKPVK